MWSPSMVAAFAAVCSASGAGVAACAVPGWTAKASRLAVRAREMAFMAVVLEWRGSVGDRQRHVDVSAGGVGVGADDVRLLDQRLQRVAVDPRGRDGERGLDAEAGRDLADADLAGDAGGRRQCDLLPGRYELQRAEEAGRVARGEQLFGIGAGTAAAAQLARGGQLHVEHLVVGPGAAVAASGGGRGGGVE